MTARFVATLRESLLVAARIAKKSRACLAAAAHALRACRYPQISGLLHGFSTVPEFRDNAAFLPSEASCPSVIEVTLRRPPAHRNVLSLGQRCPRVDTGHRQEHGARV
jgi:hypothetical protein